MVDIAGRLKLLMVHLPWFMKRGVVTGVSGDAVVVRFFDMMPKRLIKGEEMVETGSSSSIPLVARNTMFTSCHSQRITISYLSRREKVLIAKTLKFDFYNKKKSKAKIDAIMMKNKIKYCIPSPVN